MSGDPHLRIPPEKAALPLPSPRELGGDRGTTPCQNTEEGLPSVIHAPLIVRQSSAQTLNCLQQPPKALGQHMQERDDDKQCLCFTLTADEPGRRWQPASFVSVRRGDLHSLEKVSSSGSQG